jgi:hypothetical protein
MTTNPHNPNHKAIPPTSAEETLRLVVGLPAPAGLEDRVHAALRSAPRRGRVLAWPVGFRPQSSWMRTAAAAAIVFVVAGGGWGVYTRVEPRAGQNRPAKVLVMPRIGPSGGLAGAGAVRTPQTLTGPTVNPAAKPQPAPAKKPSATPAPKSTAQNAAAAQR